jgi:hypothetical protein
MRRVVPSLLAMGLAATASPAIAAKPKPVRAVCNLFADGEGDGKLAAAPVVTSPALDIVGGDVATGRSTVVALLRLKSTDTSNDTWAKALTYQWQLFFTVATSRVVFTRTVSRGSYDDSFTVRGVTGAAGDLKVVMDATSIRWTIPRKVLGTLRPKAVFSGITGATSGTGSNGDYGGNATTYTDLTPSCLRPA